MPSTAMFSKFKSGGSLSPLETNPICQFFEIGKQTASAGPELVWKIHDAYRKTDGKVSCIHNNWEKSVFTIFLETYITDNEYIKISNYCVLVCIT